MSVTRCDNESLNADSIVDLGPKHSELSSHNVCGVARKHPQSGVGRGGTTLNVGNDIVGETPRHSGLCPTNACEVARTPLDDALAKCDVSSDVSSDIGS